MEKQYVFDKKVVAITVFIYFMLAALFYYAANERICYTENWSVVEGHDGYLAELSDGTVVTQDLCFDVDYVYEIGINVATFARTNTGNIIIGLEDESGKTIAHKKVKAKLIQDNSVESLKVKKVVGNGIYTLKIISDGGEENASITLYRLEKDIV